MLSDAGHRFRLRAPEPAREHREISGMLRPPDRNPRIRKEERQIGEIRSLVDPPTGLETQQDLYDVAETDVCSRCGPLAFRRRKHDLLQERKRHGEDCGIVLMSVAVGATDHAPPIARFDGGDGCAQMDRNATVATPAVRNSTRV